MPPGPSNCPLCLAPAPPFFQDPRSGWRYLRCQDCRFVWMRPEDHPPRALEHAHYAQHQNDSEDPRYRAFLSQLWSPLKTRLPTGAEGLDYGSGPGPTLHLLASADGFPCTHYDPCFHPREDALKRRYDFITCSETAEHFHRPAAEFGLLADLLRPGGWLGLMTCRLTADIDFANWHYRHDPTHVAFYTAASLRVIARRYGFDPPEFPDLRIALLRKCCIS